MKFTLYTATDKRDNTQAYWLLNNDDDVAQYHIKTSPSRIKRNSLSPENIAWTHGVIWDTHADKSTAKLIDSWEWSL